MLKLVTRIGDNGIYTQAGDKVGIILDTVLADDIIDALNVDEDTVTTPDQQELLDALVVHKIESVNEIDYYVKATRLQEQNEEKLSEVYDVLTNMLVWDGISDSQIDDLNAAIDIMKNLEKATDGLSDKEKKKLEQESKIKKINKLAEIINTTVENHLKKCIGTLEHVNEKIKRLLEENE